MFKPFRPYHWLYPGLYQPLHAAAVLLSDLLRKPQSPEAENSMALIDTMFSLNLPKHGVVSEENGIVSERNLSEGGQEAWTFLRRLRQRAWGATGRDHTVLWPDTTVARGSPESHEPTDAASTGDPPETPVSRQLDRLPELTPECSAMAAEQPYDWDHFSEFGQWEFNWAEWDSVIAGSTSVASLLP